MSTTSPPLTIPHKPTPPLSPSLRTHLLTNLTSHPLPAKNPTSSSNPAASAKSKNKTAEKDFLPTLLTTLSSACRNENWQTSIAARVREILERGDATSYQDLLNIIVSEALPKDEEAEQGIGGDNEGEGQDAGDERGIEKADIKISEDVMRAGARVVVEGLEAAVERGDVTVEDEGGEEREWRDWR